MKKTILIAAITLAFVPSLVHADTVVIQAENYQLCLDIANSPIQPSIQYPGDLEGLDYPGEWTQYQLQAADFGSYSVRMKCWGTDNVPFHLQLVAMSAQGEDSQIIDLNFTGKGHCGL